MDSLGIDENLVRELSDVTGHGGGEEQILSFYRQLGDDALDVGHESHIEHPVRFVEDQRADGVQADSPPVDKANQSARTCHDDPGAAESLDLRVHADAADDNGAGHAGLLPRALKLSLICNASSRVGARIRTLGAFLVGRGTQKTLQDRQRKGCGLAGARLGQSHDVMPRKYLRDGLSLNRGWGFHSCML